MRKSSLKILKEEFGQYLIKNNLNIEINEKTQKGTVSYIKEVATFIENSNNINTYFLFDELDILANNFELGKSAYFFNFLISAQIEEKILFDDFIELLKNQTPSEIKDNQDLSNKFHYNLFNSVTENAAICFIKRPSYLVEMLNKIPNEVFLIHSEIIEKVIDISLNTKAFQKINFQTEVYKFIQTNTDNPSQYDHHFNLININEDNNQIKIEETQLETMKLTINVSSLMTFNLNKNYGLTDLGNLIDYLFDSVQETKIF